MKKRIRWIPWLLLLFLCLRPVTADALTALEPERDCSLTLYYSQNGEGFPELTIQLYRVAEAAADGTFSLIEPFSGYPVNIHDITSQQEWRDVATTLVAYIAADRVMPTAETVTDAAGTARFAGLQTGLYLVCGVMAENDKGVYRFESFMVYLPTPGEDHYTYDVEAKPKCSEFTPYTQYSVVKLWNDGGNAEKRPQSVTVEIRKDGIFVEEVVLNQENNWFYSWTVPDGEGHWTVVEKDVPADYQVIIRENETAFVITNSWSDPSRPPDTGHIFPAWQMILIMCVSGFGLVLLGMWRERKQS